jgi:hypothetical protein
MTGFPPVVRSIVDERSRQRESCRSSPAPLLSPRKLEGRLDMPYFRGRGYGMELWIAVLAGLAVAYVLSSLIRDLL